VQLIVDSQQIVSLSAVALAFFSLVKKRFAEIVAELG